MKLSVFVAAAFVSTALVASAPVFAQTTQTETKYVTVDGEVIRYEAGRVIAIRGADGKEVVYNLNDKSTVPADMIIGKTVTVLPLAGPGEPVAQTITYVTTTKTETVPAP